MDYEPITIKPMRMRGVFGISWMIYKRGFSAAFLYTLVLYGIIGALAMIAGYNMMENMVGMLDELWSSIGYNFDMFGMSNMSVAVRDLAPAPEYAGMALDAMNVVGSSVLLELLSLVELLLVVPILMGGLYSEMSMRIYGKPSSAGKLFKRSGAMLKRFFTTSLSKYVAELGIGLVVGLLMSVVMVTSMISMIGQIAVNRSVDPSIIIPLIIIYIVTIVLVLAGMCFVSFTYPVAVNENLRNFKAVGRSIKLVAKRFWRVLGANVLFALILSVALAVLMVACYFICGQSLLNTVPLFIAVELIISVLSVPFGIALSTTLYFDTRVRVEGEGWINAGVADTAKADPQAAQSTSNANAEQSYYQQTGDNMYSTANTADAAYGLNNDNADQAQPRNPSYADYTHNTTNMPQSGEGTSNYGENNENGDNGQH